MIRSHHVGGLLLAPVLIPQGLLVRRNVPRLPEPPCARRGTVGSGPALRLLVLGDSAAAGVGVATQAEALAGQILAGLVSTLTVHWRIEAATGARTRDALNALAALPAEEFDVAVTSLGVNDVTGGQRLETWLLQQAALVDLLHRRFGVRQVLLSALPPVYAFPALPQPLRWFLGSRTLCFDRALERLCATKAGCQYVKPEFTVDITSMATDGFHPGAGIYREWGAAVARIILEHCANGREVAAGGAP